MPHKRAAFLSIAKHSIQCHHLVSFSVIWTFCLHFVYIKTLLVYSVLFSCVWQLSIQTAIYKRRWIVLRLGLLFVYCVFFVCECYSSMNIGYVRNAFEKQKCQMSAEEIHCLNLIDQDTSDYMRKPLKPCRLIYVLPISCAGRNMC